MTTIFHYEYATHDNEQGAFTIVERSESIANVEAKIEVSRRVNPATLTRFDLVCSRPA